MTLPLLNADGVTVGRASVAEAIAGQPIKQHLIHETVVAELAARRAGTHSTLTRGKVRGGGAKPWRQKGTGRARQGSIRAPHFAGGGTTPGKVFKGTGMAGRMGHDRVTVKKATILKVDTERDLLLIKGPVPGPRNALVMVRKA